jgi:uncharacterized protein YbjT (DUF2867 family)
MNPAATDTHCYSGAVTMSRVAVIGATGRTGRLVIDGLLHPGHDVVAVSRTVGPSSERLTCVQLDLETASPTDARHALEGVDAVIFTAAGDPQGVDHHGAVLTIDAAVTAGVSRYVMLSGMGAGRTRPGYLQGGFWDSYFHAKEEAEKALSMSGMDWTVIKPAELTDEPGTGQIRISDTGTLPIETTSRASVAAVLIACLDQPETFGRSMELLEGTTPIRSALQALPRTNTTP